MPREHLDSSIPVVPILVIGGIGYYAYIQGWFSSLFGSTTTSAPPATTTPTIPTPTSTIITTPLPPTPTTHILDITGLVVIPNINGSFTGTVQIDGNPVTLSIISSDGRIFDTSGQEITGTLASEGIDVSLLRSAFLTAGASITTDLLKCIQPNVFDASGVCIDPFTKQPIAGTMSQKQQNTGVAGLGSLGQIFDWGEFFTNPDMQPRRKHLTGNFR